MGKQIPELFSTHSTIIKSLMNLYNWVKREKYKGWDPYDGMNSEVFNGINNDKLGFLLLQFNLYSPINLRPVLKIRKGTSNKEVALFARAYLHLYGISKEPLFKTEARKLLEYLEKNKIKSNSGIGWAAYYFRFIGPKHYLSPETPDIIGTTEAMKAFILAYTLFKKKRYLNLSKGALGLLLSEFLTEDSTGTYFKYTPGEKGKIVFNVSALVLECISQFLAIKYDIELQRIGEKTVEFLLKFQNPKGYWPYSYYPTSGMFYTQIDYHQGFIIDGLLSFLPWLSNRHLKSKTQQAIHLGTSFYMKEQFTKEGISYYRYPIKYPIDIHNQAQGIITFSKLYRAFDNPKYLKFAEKIALWTIRNMQDPTGYFYAHKWPGFVNKIPYMRWAQAWMMLALSSLVLYTKLNVDWRGLIW